MKRVELYEGHDQTQYREKIGTTMLAPTLNELGYGKQSITCGQT